MSAYTLRSSWTVATATVLEVGIAFYSGNAITDETPELDMPDMYRGLYVGLLFHIAIFLFDDDLFAVIHVYAVLRWYSFELAPVDSEPVVTSLSLRETGGVGESYSRFLSVTEI